MSYIEQPRDWTEQERLEWIKTYQGMLDTPINSWITEYAIDYKNKCCDNCDWFEIHKSRDGAGLCLKDVANDEFGGYIKDSDTFYCSYHKFKV